jgi:hypothetical protein
VSVVYKQVKSLALKAYSFAPPPEKPEVSIAHTIALALLGCGYY